METNQDDCPTGKIDATLSGQFADAGYRNLFEHIPVGMLLIDSEQCCADANVTISDWLGYRTDELIGLPLSYILVAEGQCNNLLPLPETKKIWQFRRKDQSLLSTAVSVSPMSGSNRLVMMLDQVDHRQTQMDAARLAAIIESSNDAIISKDLNSIITSWNRGAEVMFGYTADDMIGTSILRLIPDDRRDEELHIMGKIGRGEKVEHFETLRLTKDHRRIDVSVSASPIRDASGAIIGASKIARDISARKTQEREIHRLTRMYAALSQVNQAIVWLHDRDELFHKICEVLVRFGGFRMAWIGLLDENTQRIQPVSQWGDITEYMSQASGEPDTLPERYEPAGIAIQTGTAYICNDIAHDSQAETWRETAVKAGYQAMAALPLRQSNQVVGVINIYADETGFFQDQEMALLVEAAGDVSFALDNFEKEEAQRRTEAALQESEELFAKSFRLSPDYVVVVRLPDRIVLQVNDALCQLWGCAADEIIGRPSRDFASWLDEDERLEFMRVLAEQGEHLNYQTTLRMLDGRLLDFNISSRLITFKGSSCVLGVMREITEQKRAEAAVARLAAIVQSSDDAIIGKDREGIVTSWNPGAEKMFGYLAQEMVGESIMRIIPAERQQQETEILATVSNGGMVCHFDSERWRSDGSSIAVSITASPIKNTAGKINGVSIVATDITERKHAERLARESEAKLRKVIDGLGPYMFVGLMDIEGTVLEANKPALAAAGLKPEDVIGKPVADTYWWTYSQAVQTQLRDAVKHAAAGQPVRYDVQVRVAEGQLIWLDFSIYPFYDEAGEVAYLVPSGIVIEDRKQAQAAMQESEARYRTLFERAPDGIFIADGEGYYLDANQAMCNMMGYDREALLGLHASDIVLPEEVQYINPGLNIVKTSKDYHREWKLRRKDGSNFVADVVATQMPNGNPIGIVRDISERKHAENLLRLSEANLAASQRITHLGSWELDIAKVADIAEGDMRWSSEVFRILGHEPGSIAATYANFQAAVHPDDRKRMMEAITAALQENHAYDLTHRILRPDGTERIVREQGEFQYDSLNGQPMRMIGTVLDVTKQRRAEATIERALERLNEAQRIGQIGDWEWDIASEKITWSQQVYVILGLDPKLGPPRNYEEQAKFYDESSRQLMQQKITQVINTGEAQDYELVLLRPEGPPGYLHARALPKKDTSGKVIGLFGTVQDISESKATQAKIQKLNAELEQRVIERTTQLEAANRELETYSTAILRDLRIAEAADQIKSAFLSTMSHELRTPLNSIIGFTGIVLLGLAGSLNPEQTKQLGMVQSSARHLLALINDVLDLSKIEACQIDVVAEAFSLSLSLEQVTASVKPMADAKNLSLKLMVPPTPIEMVSDRRRVEQILINLLNNAIKFTHQGSVTLTAELVDDYAQSPEGESGQALRLSVADTGIGIKDKDLDTLFLPFRQLDSSLMRQYEGTGLGLAICRQLVGILGGEINVTSVWTKGSVFTVTLPIRINSIPI